MLRSDRQGVVKSFNKANGYGFIRVPGQSEDVHFRSSDLTPSARQVLEDAVIIVGYTAQFELQRVRDGRWRASRVKLSRHLNRLEQRTSDSASDEPILKQLPRSDSKNTSASASTASSDKVQLVRSQNLQHRGRCRGWGVHSAKEVENRITQLVAMGFTEKSARHALSDGLDVDRALDRLLTEGPRSSLLTEMSDLARDSDAVADVGHVVACQPSLGSSATCIVDMVADQVATATSPDWQDLLGAREIALNVATRAGLPSVSALGAVSLSVGEASESVRPLVRQLSSYSEGIDSKPAPPQRLARAKSTFLGQHSMEQAMDIHCGDLAFLWSDTQTEYGWIYAERLCGRSLSGWAPANIFESVPPTFRWMYTTQACQATSESELALPERSVVLVDTDARTDKDWVFVELHNGRQSGLVPRIAVADLPLSCRWVRVVISCDATHKTQVSVQKDDVLLVDLATHTEQGWTYMWASEVDESRIDVANQAGWVPTNCFEMPAP